MNSKECQWFRWITFVSIVLLLPALTLADSDDKKKDKKKAESYSATAMGVAGSVGGRSLGLRIQIKEYSTDEEIRELAEILIEGGTDALRRKMEKIDKGSIGPDFRVGTDIAAVRARPMENGTRIIIVTARPMPFFELRNSGRSTDYPFGWVDIQLDEKGRGQGAVIVAAKLKFNKEGVLEVESYGIQPIQLMNVRKY